LQIHRGLEFVCFVFCFYCQDRLGYGGPEKEDIMPALMSDFPATATPTQAEARLASESVEHLARFLESTPTDCRFRLQHDGRYSEPIGLPLSAIRLLKDNLTEMAKGHGIALLPLHAELTTQQAADLLNSRTALGRRSFTR
jgi:hypothetical protein